MFGWIKMLFKKGNKLPGLVQFILGVIIIFSVKWLVENFDYQNFKQTYLEGFGNPTKCIYYHMNGCPHCVKFSPIWDSFKKSYKGNVQLLKKERGEAGDELRKYGIQGFPTVILVDENDNKKEFQGPRTAMGLKNFLG